MSMHAEKQPTVAVEYPKTSFTLGAIGCVAGLVLCAYLEATAIEEFARAFWVVAAAIFALLLTVFAIPCMITNHAAGTKGLHLRMGILINRTIPYDAIREVAPDTVRRGLLSVGIGVRHREKLRTIFVVSSFKNLVVIKLNRELRLGGMLSPTVGQIVMSVKDIDSFLDTVSIMAEAREE